MRHVLIFMLLLLATMSNFAQEITPEITPEPEDSLPFRAFTLTVSDVSGVAPADWDEIQAGSYIRNDGEANTTYIVHVAVEGVALDDVINPFLAAYALDELPESIESYESALFQWTVYSFDFSPTELDGIVFRVDIALAENENQVFLVIFQSLVDENETLRGEILLPALDYFGMPLEEIQLALGIEPLEAVTLDLFNIETAYPSTWQVLQDGSYMRANEPEDGTTLLIQTSPDLDEGEFAELLIERLNLPIALPETSESYNTAALVWTIYRLDIAADTVALQMQIATAQDDTQAYLVVLLSLAEEADNLYETVLLPVLDATKALE